MRKLINSSVAIVLLFFCAEGYCATYYLSWGGDNSNSSADCTTGPMDMSDFNGASFNAGDTINVCDDGGVFRSQMTVPSSGSSGNPITIQAMTGDSPIISGADLLTDEGTEWEQIGATKIWYADGVSATPQIVVFDSSNVGSNHTPFTGSELVAELDYAYNTTALYVYAASDPDTAGTTIEAAQRNHCIYNSGRDYITYDGLHAYISKQRGITIWSTSDNIIVQNCEISYIDDDGLYFHANATNCVVDNCEIHHIHYVPTGDGRALLNYADGTIIKNSSFHDNGLTDVTSDVRGAEANACDAVEIYNNTFASCTGSGIEGYTATNLKAYYNLFTSGDSMEIKHGCNDALIYYNIQIGGNIPSFGDYGGVPSTGMKIYNNVWHDTRPIFDNDDGSTFDVRNNIFSYSGGYYDIYVQSTVVGLTMDNNLYDTRCQNCPVIVIVEGDDTYTLSEWQTKLGGCPNAGNDCSSVYADPLFKDASGGDFRLRGGSPAIGAGLYIDGYDLDYRGRRIDKLRPTIGAYRFINPSIYEEDEE